MVHKDMSNLLFSIRGFSIVQVSLVHTIGVAGNEGLRGAWGDSVPWLTSIVDFIHLYNMPVMMLSSGLVAAGFADRAASWDTFLTKKARRLLVPLLIWAPLFFILQALRHGQGSDLSPFGLVQAALLPYSIFWFLHAIFYASVIQRLLQGFGLSQWMRLAASAGLYAAALPLHSPDATSLKGMIHFVCYWNFFYAVGTCLLPVLGYLLSRSTAVRAATLVCAIVAMGYAQKTEWSMLAAASAWTILVLTARGLRSIGRNSLCIYLFHIYFLNVARVATLRVAPDSVALNVGLGTFCAVVGPIVLYRILKGRAWFVRSIGDAPSPTVERVSAGFPHAPSRLRFTTWSGRQRTVGMSRSRLSYPVAPPSLPELKR